MHKVILAIIDGLGIKDGNESNAFNLASTPTFDKLFKEYPHTLLQASGNYVGLPDGQMGNSEVGHLNIGAGRIVYTGLSLINKDIEDNKFKDNVAFNNAFKHVKENNSKLHIVGLFSNGGVHCSLNHIKQLILIAYNAGIKNIILHCISDGRDVDKQSFYKDIENNLEFLKQNNVTIATILGRYYAMDRDNN
jgi:2,3-bisphosphoglycerate-independent phosphoglycerate mutase